MRRLTLLVALVTTFTLVVLAPVASASSASPAPSASGDKVVYRIGLLKDFDTLNPLSTASSLGFTLMYNEYDFLTRYTTDYQVSPQLAESWTTSPDGLTWTFKLRPGVKWSDGEPLTAADVAFTYNLILREQNPNFLAYLQYVTTVEAPDDITVVVTTSQPSVRMLNLMIPILPEHVWGTLSSKQLPSFKNVPLVSSGPFQVVAAKTTSVVTAEANPYYWGGDLAVDEVLYVIYKSSETMVEDYRQGKLDLVIEPDSVSIPKLEGTPGTTVTTKPGFSWNGIGFNCRSTGQWKDNLLADKTIRQAVAWAIDKQAITELCMLGTGEAATTITPSWSSWHLDPPADILMTYDPEKANQILDAAGYSDTDGDGVRESEDGTPLEFSFTASSEAAYSANLGKLLAGYLDKVGIKLRLEVVTENTLIQKAFEGDLDMYSWGWYAEPDPAFVLSVVTVGASGGYNDTGYENAAYDKLFNEQIATLDQTTREGLVDQLQQIAYEDAPYIPIWYDPAVQAWRSDRFSGWTQAPAGGGVDYNYLYDTYVKLTPVTAPVETGGGSGSTTAIVIAIAAIVVVAGVVVLLVRRSRGRAVEE
jgi:peptide/nickel transport system substrate-binding protein